MGATGYAAEARLVSSKIARIPVSNFRAPPCEGAHVGARRADFAAARVRPCGPRPRCLGHEQERRELGVDIQAAPKVSRGASRAPPVHPSAGV